MYTVDFHSHILPRMDDGSKSIEESIGLLRMLADQGVKKVVATPHFYANDESVERFLGRRRIAYDNLKNVLSDGVPEVLLGAEVKYYEGIGKLSELKKLCVENSRLLLLEMPMAKWSEYTVREITDLSCSGKLIIVIAHIERYMDIQSRDVLYRFLENDVLIQTNADFFTNLFTRRKALGMLGDQMIHFIGSDCHNMSDRAPVIGKAVEIIRKKLGDEFFESMTDFGNSLLP